MGKKLNLAITGTQNTAYDLDKISEESRDNSSKELVVQIYTYSTGESPNPANPKLGQIWLSRKKTGEEEAATVKAVTVTGEKTFDVTIGKTSQYVASVSPSTASQSVAWVSSDISVATIDGDGLATFVKAGVNAVSFTATSDVDSSISGSITVKATVKPVPEAVTISGDTSEITLGLGKTYTRQFSASVTPPSSVQGIIWSVENDDSDGSSITMSSNGLLSVVCLQSHLGKAITVKAKSSADEAIFVTKTIIVNSYSLPTAITVVGDTDVTLEDTSNGTAAQYMANIVGGGYDGVVWKTGNSSIATIDSTGLATFHKAGSVSVTAASSLDESIYGSLDVSIAEVVE